MRSSWTLYPGRGRVPDAAAPDVRARSYTLAAQVRLQPGDGGVVVAHGDRHAGYALRVHEGHLVHHYVHAQVHSTVTSTLPVPTGDWVQLEVQVRRSGESGLLTLLVDGHAVGSGVIPALARARIGYIGLDLGCDRGQTVGGYPSPSRFTGELRSVEVTVEDDQWLDIDALWEIEGSTG